MLAREATRLPIITAGLLSCAVLHSTAADPSLSQWQLGTPIVTYWAGPPMTDATAGQMAEGGWNLVWCTENDLDVAKRHGLRAQLQDPLLSPAALDEPAQKERLDALLNRVRSHPALYAYFITDEPNATNFPALGKLVAYLRERDPQHLAYINLFPTYASNSQLGNQGNTTVAYSEHLRQFVETVKPDLISYDHYQFGVKGDTEQYFLNLALIRNAAQGAKLPFLNIVQACTWTPSMRVPNSDEMRYLVYTTLAYGAQGISYYVYCCAGHTGGIANADGSPTSIYYALRQLNREFVNVAKELQLLQSIGVYHITGKPPSGTEPLPAKAVFRLAPGSLASDKPENGVLLGYFGRPEKKGKAAKPTFVLVANLDYRCSSILGLRGPSRLETFDASEARWSRAKGKMIELNLPPGGGKLLRVRD